jgi:two-component system, sensor histidine kinase and response regulator
MIMTHSKKPARVLIVDDDPLSRETLQAILHREGYTLLFAVSGVEALANLSEFAPDLILLDVMMPIMNGFEVCAQIKGKPEFRHIPLILITALDDTAELVRGLDLGADEFITKPFNTAELKARVRSMLRIRQQYDELQYMLQTRDILSGMIVHDLRNPLAAVMLYIQLLQRKGSLPPDQAKYLGLIYNEAHHVSDFLEDILLLTKLDREKVSLTLTELDLPKLLNEVKQGVTNLSESRMVALEIGAAPPSPPGKMVDMMLLTRAVQHLMTHAIKSAPQHTRVRLQVDYSSPPITPAGEQTSEPTLQIKVRNDSLPIPLEDLERLFDKYALVTMHQRGKPHTGLGLAYCKIVVEAHSGRITAINLEPQGILFTIEV